jgi:protein-S-isoprenylcysteine O-methyltransferase Ste14
MKDMSMMVIIGLPSRAPDYNRRDKNMEHLFFREAASALFLLLIGAARYYYSVSAGRQPADRAGPAGNWAHHIPAYFTSTAWTIYVAWLILAPPQLADWDRWPLNHLASDMLGWASIPVFAAGFGLFWYSHYTIGRYWSIRIHMKQAHRLVTSGPYAYIRHPLYTALFLAYLGTLLALQSWVLAAWFPVFVASYLVFANEEETVMERAFGEEYARYRRETEMFFPKWSKIRAGLCRAARLKTAHGARGTRRGYDDNSV